MALDVRLAVVLGDEAARVGLVAQNAVAAGAQVVLDAGFTPVGYQDSLGMGADVIVHSSTKTMDGQGRVMGGAILGRFDYIDGPVKQLMRHTGPALSPFNAWTLLKGLETMRLRVDASVASALRIAEFLEADPRVRWTKYPFITSHPQYDLATKQMSGGGTVVPTGPLGQGLSTAVGMALAERALAAEFGDDLVDHRTWVFAGDGCLMEGISQEAIALAGHLKLGRLIVLWDNNDITIDGAVSLSDSTDQLKRFEASGWRTLSCDGHNPADIDRVHLQGLAPGEGEQALQGLAEIVPPLHHEVEALALERHEVEPEGVVEVVVEPGTDVARATGQGHAEPSVLGEHPRHGRQP